jgi:phospholipid/cholesterol/gamma-HCH transport system permease protein
MFNYITKIFNSILNQKNDDSDTSETRGLRGFFLEVALVTKFAGHFFKEVFKRPYELSEFIKQSFQVGYKSLPLVGITGFIMGLVLTIQSRPALAEFGAESLLTAMVAVSLVREVVPVITALICAGKVGSGIGAELASMRVTEQIDAMEVSGTNPFKYLVVTRILSTTLMVPLLAILSDVVGLFGAFLAVNIKGDQSIQLFIHKTFASLDYSDVLPAFIKTFFFGFAIGLIGCFKGYNATRGTEGVGVAANVSVVIASLLIFILDMLSAQIVSLFF